MFLMLLLLSSLKLHSLHLWFMYWTLVIWICPGIFFHFLFVSLETLLSLAFSCFTISTSLSLLIAKMLSKHKNDPKKAFTHKAFLTPVIYKNSPDSTQDLYSPFILFPSVQSVLLMTLPSNSHFRNLELCFGFWVISCLFAFLFVVPLCFDFFF